MRQGDNLRFFFFFFVFFQPECKLVAGILCLWLARKAVMLNESLHNTQFTAQFWSIACQTTRVLISTYNSTLSTDLSLSS